MAVSSGVLLEIILVILLGGEEVAQRLYLDSKLCTHRVSNLRIYPLDYWQILFRHIVYSRAIACTYVATLLV